MGTEFELKLELGNPDDADFLVRALGLGPPETVKLHSVYFDTPDHLLARQGYGLRIRKEGRRLVQTVKSERGPGTGSFARMEWEQDVFSLTLVLDDQNPIANMVGALASSLAPRFEVENERSRWLIESADADIELAFDHARASADDRNLAFTELELELKRGDPLAVFALARRINRLTPVRIVMISKAGRARRLVKLPGKADKAETVALTHDMNAQDAFRLIAMACLRQYRLNEDRLLVRDNSAALHQARVALRRLRSAFVAFGPMVRDRKLKRLKTDLRWLAEQMGQARNIDVLLPKISGTRSLARVKARRKRAYADARHAITSALARELMIDLAEWLSLGRWTNRARTRKLREQPARDFSAHAISRLHDRLIHEAAAIADQDDEARHIARKTAKKLRYIVESTALLFDKGKERKARIRYLAALEELQDNLGKLNDLAVIPVLLEEMGMKREQAAFLDASLGERDLYILQAGHAAALVESADRFWD